MRLADRMKAIKPSATLTLSSKAKALKMQGIDVIDLSTGEPDFDTPDIVKRAAREAIRIGFTKYTAVSGIDELKTAIIEKLKKDNGLAYDKSQIIVSCGVKHSLYNITQVLFGPGDEIIIPTPCWVTYPDQVRLSGATPIFVRTDEQDGFQLHADRIKNKVSAKTKAIILNSPCNPTGSAYHQKTLEEVADIVMEQNLYVISDEIYEPLVYDEFQHISIAASSPAVQERTLLVNGVSKAYAMTGWRIGYTAGPKEVISAMGILQSQSTSNPTSIAQKAATVALIKGRPFTKKMVAEFDRRRRYIVERLNKITGIFCGMPRGAFYVFANISGIYSKRYRGQTLSNASGVAEFLLDEAKVAVVPGEPFESPDHIRVSYAASMEELHKALNRIEAAFQILT